MLHTRAIRATLEAEGRTGKELPPVSCTRESLLRLPRTAYEVHAPAVEKGFIEAGKFLMEQKILFGRDLPYPPQVVALGAVFAVAGTRVGAAGREKLARWYWSGVLGEYYGSATETKIARDFPELLAWLDGGPAPRTIADTYFQTDRLDTLRIRLAAAYKGMHALLMRHGCRDFITGKGVETMTVFQDDIECSPATWTISTAPINSGSVSKRLYCARRRRSATGDSGGMSASRAPTFHLVPYCAVRAISNARIWTTARTSVQPSKVSSAVIGFSPRSCGQAGRLWRVRDGEANARAGETRKGRTRLAAARPVATRLAREISRGGR